MLVLTRKPGQSIIIGDGIEVEVLSVGGEKVRLGITAPREVQIYRDEVYDRIRNEKEAESEQAAAKNGADPERSAAPSRP